MEDIRKTTPSYQQKRRDHHWVSVDCILYARKYSYKHLPKHISWQTAMPLIEATHTYVQKETGSFEVANIYSSHKC